MKKALIIITLLLAQNLSGQNALVLTVEEKTKKDCKPLANTEVEVLITDSNKITDTIQLKMTTSANGELDKIPLSSGEKNITIKCAACKEGTVTYIQIAEDKITYAEICLLCQSYINTLSKRQKRKQGIE